jgi:hypothetical protein
VAPSRRLSERFAGANVTVVQADARELRLLLSHAGPSNRHRGSTRRSSSYGGGDDQEVTIRR